MATLYELVVNFRNAIDEAKARREFNSRSCLFRFPDDCCDMTCDLLAEYLREHGIYTFQINGKHKYDNQWHHVWLETDDGIVIDITDDTVIVEFGNNKNCRIPMDKAAISRVEKPGEN